VYGVLDIRGTGERDFPKHTEAIAALLGRQLGLYHYLANTIRRLHLAERDLRKQLAKLQQVQKQQTQTFEDFAHQLKTPIFQAHERIQRVLESVSLEDRARSDLNAVRAVCGKAKRVAMNTRLFAVLAGNEVGHLKTRLRRKRLEGALLIRMLNEAATDNELTLDPKRRIGFKVQSQGFDALQSTTVLADASLLEQAIMNALDNASKYSFPATTVQIDGGLVGTDRFHISVASRGLPIYESDVPLCVQRSWRSEQARWTTGEGSGIGLWFVDHIMKAHDGELIIIPTTPDGLTEIHLVFPCDGER
jgi:signal transduction histidine kinase